MRPTTTKTPVRQGLLLLLALVLPGGVCRSEVDEGFDRGTRLVYELDLRRVAEEEEDAAAATREGIRKRLLALGARRFRLRPEGTDRLIVEIADRHAEAVAMVRRAVELRGRLAFHLVAEGEALERPLSHYERAEKDFREAEARWVRALREWRKQREADPDSVGPRPAAPDGPEYIVRSQRGAPGREPEGASPSSETKETKLLLENRPESVVSGRRIESVASTWDRNLRPAVHVRLSEAGGKSMEKLTASNIGRRLAIVLDDRVITAPVIRSRFSRNAQITADFTEDEAANIAAALRSQALPVAPELVKQEAFGPESSPSPRPDEAPAPEKGDASETDA